MTGMRCSEVESHLVDVVDGRLDPAASVRFHHHLEGCASCRERAALWRALTPGMRAVTPDAPDAMTARRMQIEVERRLVAQPSAAPPPRWRLVWAPALAVAAVAAIVAVRSRAVPSPVAVSAVGYAAVSSSRGTFTVGGRAVSAGTRVAIDAPIAVAAGGAGELALDGGSTLRVEGPAELTLAGGARDAVVHLAGGRVSAHVARRQQGETFAVVTRDLRVDVRGTQFSVVASAAGSRVAVTEGRVEVRFADGRSTFVNAGGSVDSAAPGGVVPDDVAAAEAAPALPPQPPSDRPPACADVTRACQVTARSVHGAMRGGDTQRAMRLIADGGRDARAADTNACPEIAPCQDELRYLRAEVLNQAGRFDDAIAAYHALDRRGAPPAMRQNALYAAAQIERRQGRLAAARADYERALAVTPRAALHEEALVGAMETASAAGDSARARALATRYLKEFPRGLAVATARQLADGGARP